MSPGAMLTDSDIMYSRQCGARRVEQSNRKAENKTELTSNNSLIVYKIWKTIGRYFDRTEIRKRRI